MRECFTYGSVRGVAGNGGPYRDPQAAPKRPRFSGSAEKKGCRRTDSPNE